MGKFPFVSFADFAKPVSRPIQVEAGKQYRTLGVKWWGEGAYERRTFDGSRIQAKILSIVREGDLIFSKIWVRHGSSGIIPKKMDGCIASSDFPTFELDEQKVNRSWLLYLFKTKWFWEECDKKSRGTSGKNRIRPSEYLRIEIPLPPLAEQQRIVARVDALAQRVEEARGLRRAATDEVEALMLSYRNEIFDAVEKEFTNEELGSICTVVRGSSPRPKGDPHYYGGPVPRLLIADISRDGKYVTPSIDSLTLEGARLSRPMPKGSLVLAISGSYGVPAFLAVDACIHDGFIGFRDMQERLDAEFLYQVILFRRGYFDSVVKNSGLQNLTTNHLNRMVVPLPSLADQRRIVAYLDGLQAKVDELRRLQAATQKELDALMPSILAKAFAGEL